MKISGLSDSSFTPLASLPLSFGRAMRNDGLPMHQPVSRRALDLLCCFFLLPLLCLIAVVMTVTTALTSPGPVIFRQRRIGYRGREFMLYKFRTMHVGADPTLHQKHFKVLVDSKAPMAKLDSCRDSRLLPGGRLLRACGLDELPQVINVLRGEMSLVGPRPCLPSEFAHYQPAQRERANALPGLTGLWQVSGKNHTTFEEMIRLDIHYVRHASVLLYLKIVLLTPLVLIRQTAETFGRLRSPSLSSDPAAAASS
jgi:lipopolysaccharide/colanic/teichoic acid biosynthesis glycosyltransferase